MSRPCRTHAVTAKSPARSVFCKPRSTARSARTSGKPHCARERLGEAAEIARRIGHVGLCDLDIMQAHHRVDLHRPGLGALAHHLPVKLRFRRHVDEEIAAKARLAAQPLAAREGAPHALIAFLDRIRAPSHGRAPRQCRASDPRLRRWRPGSVRKCRARRRPNRDRRRACARPRARSSLRQSAHACRRERRRR